MKKPCFLPIFFTTILFMAAVPVSAQENEAAEATDRTLASIDQENKTSIARQVQKAGQETAPKEDLSGTKTGPESVAVFSEETQDQKAPAATVDPTGKGSGETETAGGGTTKKEPPAILPEIPRTAETEKNWDAFFSKKTAPSSDIYTVKSGDSLYVIANKNHTTVDLIKKMNGLTQDNIYTGMKLKLFKGSFSIVVYNAQNILVLFADGKPIRKYHVSTGKNNSTPRGEFTIVHKLVNPTWFKTGAIYPPGSPDNALGTRWLGFDKPAYGIHGTIEPQNIGKSVSQGCIRMLNRDAEELYSIVPSGTKVTVTD